MAENDINKSPRSAKNTDIDIEHFMYSLKETGLFSLQNMPIAKIPEADEGFSDIFDLTWYTISVIFPLRYVFFCSGDNIVFFSD